MNTREAIKAAYAMPDQICRGYLNDLTDADLMKRPVPNSNHIAWQLGHLIQAENSMINQVSPGVMPTLPAGFAEKHNKTTAASDDPSKFLKKNDYLELYDATRRGTLKAIESVIDTDLDKQSPENVRQFAPTIAAIFLMQPTHWMMHAGQWAIVRRSLGKPPLF